MIVIMARIIGRAILQVDLIDAGTILMYPEIATIMLTTIIKINDINLTAPLVVPTPLSCIVSSFIFRLYEK
jgi:hypothetical protein